MRQLPITKTVPNHYLYVKEVKKYPFNIYFNKDRVPVYIYISNICIHLSCKFVNSENNGYCAIKWGMQLKVGKRYVAQSV